MKSHLDGSRIIERLDRKLADVIGSNTVEKCDVTLQTSIQPLTSDVLRVFNCPDCPCFEVKDEEYLFLAKTIGGYKSGRGKRQSK